MYDAVSLDKIGTCRVSFRAKKLQAFSGTTLIVFVYKIQKTSTTDAFIGRPVLDKQL